MTIGMLALAGIPGTVGFIGKFQLIHALVNGSYTWLAIVLIVGSMISLGYYLRVIAAIWMRPVITRRPAIAGASQEADTAPVRGGDFVPDAERPAAPAPRALQFEVAYVALAFAAAVIFFGIIPSPLFHFAAHAGTAIAGLFSG
jgi:NADH-quinone oxidoreductase subunit N